MKKCLKCKKEHNNKKFCSQICSNSYKRFTDITGKKFGKWTVIKLDNIGKESVWLCKCECGFEKLQKRSVLTGGYSKKCRNCKDLSWRNTKILSLSAYNKFRSLAIKRNIKWNLNRLFLERLLIKQNFKCKLSGSSICLSKTTYGHNHSFSTASLDRIDSSKDYTKDNVQWVHKRINKIKQDLKESELIDWCRKVVNNVSIIGSSEIS